MEENIVVGFLEDEVFITNEATGRPRRPNPGKSARKRTPLSNLMWLLIESATLSLSQCSCGGRCISRGIGDVNSSERQDVPHQEVETSVFRFGFWIPFFRNLDRNVKGEQTTTIAFISGDPVTN